MIILVIVWKDDQPDLVEEAPGHEDDKDEVHDGEHAQGHALGMRMRIVRWI